MSSPSPNQGLSLLAPVRRIFLNLEKKFSTQIHLLAFLKNIPADANDPAATDDQLVASYRQSSDLRILASLYQRYLDLLYGVCLKYLGEPESAKDAVMDIFEELTQKLPKHEVTYFRGWLYTLAKNHCLMKLRSSSRLKVSSFDPEHMQTAEDLHLNDKMEMEEQLGKLTKCLETLSPDQRTVVELFYLQNKCYKEIETITKVQWNKVRSHIQNGRRNLKICMEKQEETTPSAAILTVGGGSDLRKADKEGTDPALAI